MDLLCDARSIIDRTSAAQPDLSSYVLLATLLSTHDAKLWKSDSIQSHSRAIDQTGPFGALYPPKPRQLTPFPRPENYYMTGRLVLSSQPMTDSAHDPYEEGTSRLRFTSVVDRVAVAC